MKSITDKLWFRKSFTSNFTTEDHHFLFWEVPIVLFFYFFKCFRNNKIASIALSSQVDLTSQRKGDSCGRSIIDWTSLSNHQSVAATMLHNQPINPVRSTFSYYFVQLKLIFFKLSVVALSSSLSICVGS